MKRSEINRAIGQAITFFKRMNIHLPPFPFWTTEEWIKKGNEVDQIRNTIPEYDVIDIGRGDFHIIGRTLFTLRNGSYRYREYQKVCRN